MSTYVRKTKSFFDDHDRQQLVVDAVKTGIRLSAALVAVGATAASLKNWIYAYEHGKWPDGSYPTPQTMEAINAFFERIEVAQAEYEKSLVAVVSTAAKTDWKPAAWLLEHGHTRRHYYRHIDHPVIDVKIAPSDSHAHVAGLPTEELLSYTDPEWVRLLPQETES